MARVLDDPVLATEADQLRAKLRELETQLARQVTSTNYWRARAEAQRDAGWRVVKLEACGHIVPENLESDHAHIPEPAWRIVDEKTW